MDYNSTTPVRDEVLDVLERTARDHYANPSSLYMSGREAKVLMDNSREKVAEVVGARPSEIIFTSGGSESNNIAIKGAAWRRGSGHIITSAVEHPSVLKVCRFLETQGFSVTYIPVDASGCVDPSAVMNAFRDDTFLISVMWANNETGVLQPVAEIGKIASERGILFHTDAVQAVGKLPVDVKRFPVDMLSISGHKIYAPKGAGALYIRRGTGLEALVHGGGQEKGLRSGTEALPGIVALAEACRLMNKELGREIPRITKLRDMLEKRILVEIPRVRVNGDQAKRIPNTSNVTFSGAKGEAVLICLDELGIAASSASACAAGQTDPSHVLLAMGLSKEEAEASMRFSLGRLSKVSHIKKLLDVLPGIIEQVRTLTENG